MLKSILFSFLGIFSLFCSIPHREKYVLPIPCNNIAKQDPLELFLMNIDDDTIFDLMNKKDAEFFLKKNSIDLRELHNSLEKKYGKCPKKVYVINQYILFAPRGLVGGMKTIKFDIGGIWYNPNTKNAYAFGKDLYYPVKKLGNIYSEEKFPVFSDIVIMVESNGKEMRFHNERYK